MLISNLANLLLNLNFYIDLNFRLKQTRIDNIQLYLNIVEHFGDASVNHNNPSMSKAKDKVRLVFWIHTFIKNAPNLRWKYFAININVLHSCHEIYSVHEFQKG